MKLPQDKIDSLKSQHGEVYELESTGYFLYVRKPSRPEYQRFRDQMMDENRRGRSIELLLKAVVVSPDATGVEAMIDDRPGCVDTFGEMILEIAGSTRDAISKKL